MNYVHTEAIDLGVQERVWDLSLAKSPTTRRGHTNLLLPLQLLLLLPEQAGK